MTREATFGGDAIRRQFSELADLLENDVTVYLIGGGALTLNDLKNATKDIDVAAVERVLDSPTAVLHPTEADFEATYEQFRRYEDHAISFTDHMSSVLASDRGIEHVFTFDPDHFRTLDCIAVPADTGDSFET